MTHDIDEAVQLADRVVVLSSRPAKIQDILTIDIPHPRNISSAALSGTSRRAVEEDRLGLHGMNSLAKPASMGEVLLAAARRCAVSGALALLRRLDRAPRSFPRPVSVEKGLAELLHKHVLWSDIGDSLRRVAIGFGTAAVDRNSARAWPSAGIRRRTRS